MHPLHLDGVDVHEFRIAVAAFGTNLFDGVVHFSHRILLRRRDRDATQRHGHSKWCSIRNPCQGNLQYTTVFINIANSQSSPVALQVAQVDLAERPELLALEDIESRLQSIDQLVNVYLIDAAGRARHPGDRQRPRLVSSVAHLRPSGRTSSRGCPSRHATPVALLSILYAAMRPLTRI